MEKGLPPLSLMFKYSIESDFEVGTREFNDWLFRWAYPKALQSDSQFELIVIGRILYWGYTHQGGLVSTDALKSFETYILDNIFKPSEGLKEYSSNFASTITIFGEPELSIGIGIDAKLTKRTLDKASISSQYHSRNNETIYSPINIFSTPAPSAMVYLAAIKKSESLSLSNNILSCPSEHYVWPECNNFLLDYFDNIWLHSRFVYDSLPESVKPKAQVVPLPVDVLGSPNSHVLDIFSKKHHKIFSGTSYKFIVSFDLCSSIARKNPFAAIDAFNLAFCEKNDSAMLIVKLNNGDLRPEFAKEVIDYCSCSSNIYVINEGISFDELLVLYESVDCYVSLHRSEGFGRNIAEMMLLKKPVIVTAFSGNMDFNNDENSWLVPYKLVSMRTGEYLYAQDQVWADADINIASDLMLEVYKSKGLSDKVNNAYKTIADNYSIDACARKYRDILEGLA